MASAQGGFGRPTQFHGVPVEARAFDSSGKRLPWALEYPDDYPNTRHQKREAEEKGAFGKSLRQRGRTTRSTRTQTPARKENPTLDGFEAALKCDSLSQDSVDEDIARNADAPLPSNPPPVLQEPTPVILYGHTPETRYDALNFYETVSGGLILEDYDRTPPADALRLGLSLLHGTPVKRHALTPAERHAAAEYAGGNCWIKVTFASHAAADRALATSPHVLHGHWVYASPWTGKGPDVDEPIPVEKGDNEPGALRGPQPPSARAATMTGFGPVRPSRTGSQQNNTLPSNYRPPWNWSPNSAESSNTLESSDTLLGPQAQTLLEASGRREEAHVATSSLVRAGANGAATGAEVSTERDLRSRTFKFFPEKANELRDASDALLPSPSWVERLIGSLRQSGLFPKDVIGSTVPRLEDGSFDWNAASFYWRMCHWLDSFLGTDICGMRES